MAQYFIKALRVAGGAPARAHVEPAEPPQIERPEAVSTVFTYHSAGKLIPGTGFKSHDGRADTTVYARIRFPLADAPAYANSQSFMNWGDCNLTGRVPGVPRAKGEPYRCRLNNKPLVFDESAPENYAYPWRDNFCEHRHFFVGQCPGGRGHQGQDIRPANCTLRNEGADRCEPYEHDVVAVRDGAILRAPGQEAVYLVVNTASERMRFRYMHMNPHQSDAANLVNGRMVREGERIGKVGNYNRREGGTTYHLHFDVQVPTRDGWVFVNPYMTLVTAYERLIGGRGVEIKPSVAEEITLSAPPPVTTEPEKKVKNGKKVKKKRKATKPAKRKKKRRR